METNDSNIKPQQTGGLKLMTVFIVVLALHVVVIGGFTVYHLMSGGNADVDLTDKAAKGVKVTPDGTVVADAPASDSSQPDKSTTASTAPPETTGTPAPAPTTDTATSTDTSTPAPASTSAETTPAQTPPAPASASVATASAEPPPAPVPSQPSLAPPPDTAPAPSEPVVSGPVKMPAFEPAPPIASAPAPVTGTTYVVKITDSYAKIAHRYHISVAKLKEANNAKTNTLHTGQKLIIPEKTQVAATSLDSAPTGPITADSLASESTSTPAPGTAKSVSDTSSALSAASPSLTNHRTYTVVKGDTLSKIAHKFKTTATALMTANNITDPTKLSIGKKLKIPSKEARSAKISEPATSPTSQPSQVQAKAAVPTGQLANFVP